MKTMVIILLLLSGFTLVNCSAKHPKIGFLIHSYDAPRWKNDQRYLTDAVNQLNGTAMVRVADNNAKKQIEQAKELIRKGAMVLIVIPVDQAEAAEIVRLAHKKEIRVIAYDRLINNCRLDYYVSTDNIRVGEIQASYLTKIKPKGNYAIIGGPPNDNNSRMLYIGQMNILQPFIEREEIKLAFRQFADSWTEQEGYRLTQACLQATHKKLDAIICGNDAMALGAIRAIKENHLSQDISVAGQDADLANIEQITKGNQSVTVFKRIKTMATTAADLAIHIANGESIDPYFSTISNGERLVPSYLIDALAVHEGNVEMTVIAEGN